MFSKSKLNHDLKICHRTDAMILTKWVFDKTIGFETLINAHTTMRRRRGRPRPRRTTIHIFLILSGHSCDYDELLDQLCGR